LYLDIDYMDGYRIFTWSPKNFPHPKEMIADLTRQGFHVAVIVDPGIKADSSYHAFRSGLADGCFLRYPDGTLYTGKVWPGVCAFPDFSFERGRRWWGDQFKVLTDAGVRGWWNDMNEPSVFDVPTKTIDLNVIHDDDGLRTGHDKNHNVYGMDMTRATYEGVKRLLPDERPFVLTRASFAGGWRYSAAWTGDNVASWEHLAMAVSMCLNLSISGQPFVGADIGGFIGYPSGELFARWLELGVFTPLMRAHSVINERNKEPWEYGDSCTAINRGTIELRYRMLPYIYTVMEQASRTGLPAMRPIVLEFPADERFHNRADEFMFGDGLLVAPVLAPGAREREVLLPAGGWYDFWADTALQAGGKAVTVAAPLARLPLFVREGTVLPARQVVQFTGEAPIDPLTLRCYPGAAGKEYESMYYEDDGNSFAYTRGAYLRRTVTQRRGEGATTIRLSPWEGSYRPPVRGLVLEVKSIVRRPSKVAVNGQELPSGDRPGRWAYDIAGRTLRVFLTDSPEAITVRVEE
ncbi:MAG TPA: TIM-barrel domain-containing protein, partial [Bacteroidota bacterium]